MALQALHEHFWPGDGLVNNTPAPPTGWSAVATLLAGTTFALLLMLASGGVTYALVMPAWGSFFSRLWCRVPARVRLLVRVARLLWSTEFARADVVVRGVATTPGLRERRHWGEIGCRVGAIPGVGENVFRHLLAAETFDGGVVRFHKMHQRNLLLELAYYGLKEF